MTPHAGQSIVASALTAKILTKDIDHIEDNLAWYAVWTRSRHERRVFDQLQAKGIEAFFPTTHRWSQYHDRRKRIEWPLFPGYCFVRTDARSILPVVSCAGASQLVSIAGKPAAIPDYEIEGIARLVSTTLKYDCLPFVDEGALVRVVRGPLAGTQGRLLKKGQDAHLLLALELLGRVLSVHVDAADVEKIDKPDKDRTTASGARRG